MTTVLIVIHLMVVLAMIGLVLLQRSEGGALGIGGGQGAFMSGRSAGNVLTRTTGILAAAFFATSIGLAILARIGAGPSDIFDTLPGQTAPVVETPAQPAAPIAAPESAEDVFEQLGGGEPGPQVPPTDAAPGDAAPAAGSQAPAPAEQPAAPGQ
jgi:preprotein translocase subunit SecG